MDIPKISKKEINGDLSSWVSQAWQALCLLPDTPRPPADSGARLFIAWDEVGLIFGVQVFDKTPSESFLASGAYENDSVEFFIAPSATRAESLQAVLSPGNEPGRKPRLYLYDNRPDALKNLPARLEYAVVLNETGYNVEARFPWECLGINPKVGDEVAARVFVNDHDGVGRKIRFSLIPQKSPFYRLHLTERPNRPIHALAWASFDPAVAEFTLNCLASPSLSGAEVKWLGSSFPSLTLNAGSYAAWLSVGLSSASEVPDSLTLPDGLEIPVVNNLEKIRENLLLDGLFPQRCQFQRRQDASFAGFGFPVHVFSGPTPPAPQFAEPRKVERLLEGQPEVSLQWFDSEGNPIPFPQQPGLLGCLAEIRTPAGKSYRKRFLLYRLPNGAQTPPGGDDEYIAQVLGFNLAGADATKSHANRVANLWWHKALKKLLAFQRQNGSHVESLATYPYGVRFPKNYSHDRRYPLLLYLHGSGFSTTSAEKEFFTAFSDALDYFPGIVVYPRSAGSWSAPAVLELLDLLISKYPIDAERVSIVGFSMGGIGAWEVLLTAPSRFACAAIIAGRGGSPTDAWRLKNIPILVVNGTDDPTTTVQEAEIMVQAIQQAGGNLVEKMWIEGSAHHDSMFRALSNPGLYRWIAEKITSKK
ncbi:MAG: alpha/beta hydrolase-fold protein [Chthoniobacterales bacterium]|nr:alpha/beta hydrolase-fold protein [Chthoniobacterales bacterium]